MTMNEGITTVFGRPPCHDNLQLLANVIGTMRAHGMTWEQSLARVQRQFPRMTAGEFDEYCRFVDDNIGG